MNKRVLIVDDDPDMCGVLSRLLRLKQIESDCAGTFGEALDCVQISYFDLIILDLGLPDSAPEVTLNRLTELKVKTLIFTGVNEPEIIRECQRRNIRFILKGTSATGMMREILLALEWGEPSREIERELVKINQENLSSESSGVRIKRWLASNAIAIIVVLFLVLDHFTGFIGGVRGDATSAAALRQQIVDNTRALTLERESREASQRGQSEINAQMISDLKSIHIDLGGLHMDAERIKASREDMSKQIDDIRQTTNAIYKYLLEQHK